ncbi:MAG: thioredoxin family protein [Bacteroidota bacterium]
MEKELHSISQTRNLIQEKTAVLLYFYNDHCAPCLSLRPKVIDLISSQYENINLYFINSEQHPEFASAFGVYENPVLLLFFDGKETYRGSKYISLSELSEVIKRPYSIIFED